MSHCEKGRFCGKCQSEVIDFTKMPRDQVVDYLLNKANQDTCGRYKNHLLGKQKNRLQNFLINMHHKVYSHNRFKLTKFVILMTLGLILSLTGCGNKDAISGEYYDATIYQDPIDYSCGGKMRVEPQIIDLPVEKIERKTIELPFYNFKKK